MLDEDLDDLARLVGVAASRATNGSGSVIASRGAGGSATISLLRGDDLGDAELGEREQRVELARA